jgi:translation initiation factor IF-3
VELGFVESAPKQDGRNMIMVLGPHKRKAEAMAEARERGPSAAGVPPTTSSTQASRSTRSSRPDGGTGGVTTRPGRS